MSKGIFDMASVNPEYAAAANPEYHESRIGKA